MPATILKVFELAKKNFPINEAVEPKAINTKEKPKVKKIVLITIKFLFCSFILLNEVAAETIDDLRTAKKYQRLQPNIPCGRCCARLCLM